MLFPRRCPVCGAVGEAPCRACLAELRRAPSLPPPSAVDWCHALLAYEDAGRALVSRLKYRNARDCVRWLGWAMARLVANEPVDVITWIPTSTARRHERGFDQAELLARAVGHHLRRPCRSLLLRDRSPPQTGRNGRERRVGPGFVVRGEAAPRRPATVLPATVLLVDDVITTGSTVTAATLALKAEVGWSVGCVVAARTPLKRASSRSDTEEREAHRTAL